ncbi:hypothetical protein [Nonomuraea sp. NPDC002799]
MSARLGAGRSHLWTAPTASAGAFTMAPAAARTGDPALVAPGSG